MLDAFFRRTVDRWFVIPVLPFLDNKTTPMQVTACALLCGSVAAVLIALHLPLLACLLLFLSGYLDMLDGALARYSNSASALGSVFDIVSDRAVEAFIMLAFYLAGLSPFWVLLMLVSSYLCVASFLVVAIFSANDSEKSFHYSVGLIERAEAFIFFALITLFPPAFIWLAFLYTTLVLYTTAARLFDFYRQAV